MSLNARIKQEDPGKQLQDIQEHEQEVAKLAAVQAQANALEQNITEGVKNLGPWNASTNTPTLTADASAYEDGWFFDAFNTGLAPFAGINFSVGQPINPGDKLKVFGNQFYLIPFGVGDDSITLEKLQAELRALLSRLSSMYVEYEEFQMVDAIVDENGASPWSIDKNGNVLHKGQDVLTIAKNAETIRPLVTALQTSFANLKPQVESLLSTRIEYPDEDRYVDGVVDENGASPWLIDKDGNVLHKGQDVLSMAKAALALGPVVTALQNTFSQIQTQVTKLLETQVSLPDEDRYVDGVVDENGAGPWLIDKEGNVLHKGVNVLAVAQAAAQTLAALGPKLELVLAAQAEYEEPRFLAGDVDENGAAVLLYDHFGNPWFKGRNILAELTALKNAGVPADVLKLLYPTTNFSCWGDSLTAATYPTQLAAMYAGSRTVFNGGVGGDTSTQVAFRQGAIAVGLTFPDNQIPAAVSAISVTPSETEIIQKNRNVMVAGRVAGIAGTLTRDADGNYFFTRATAGAVIITDKVMMFAADANGRDYDNVVNCVGRNNFLNPSRVLADVAAMVAFLKPVTKRFLILPVLNGNFGGESKGGANYNTIMALNKSLRETYPRNFADHREALIRAYNPNNPQDVIDVANDVVPSSLRIDDIHLTNAGYAIKAQIVKKFFDSNNW